MKNIESLKEQTFALDMEFGSFSGPVETLSDIQQTFASLMTEMEVVVLEGKGHEKICFPEWFRQLRLMSQLMRYSMNDLEPSFEKAMEIHTEMFHTIVEINDLSIKKTLNPSEG